MNVKTMEGLAGASASINMVSTPMNVAKEAERKGDTEKMQRALGYAAGLMEQAGEYSEKTDKGMKLDREEARKQEKLRQEELAQAIKTRREEAEKQEEGKRTEEGAGKGEGQKFDSVNISEEGKYQSEISGQTVPDIADGMENAAYSQSGEIAAAVEAVGSNVDISV